MSVASLKEKVEKQRSGNKPSVVEDRQPSPPKVSANRSSSTKSRAPSSKNPFLAESSKEEVVPKRKVVSAAPSVKPKAQMYDYDVSYINCNVSASKYLFMVDINYAHLLRIAPKFCKMVDLPVYRMIMSHALLHRCMLIHKGRVPKEAYAPLPMHFPLPIQLFDVLAFVGKFPSPETHTTWVHRLPLPSKYYGKADSVQDYPWERIAKEAVFSLTPSQKSALKSMSKSENSFYGREFFLSLYLSAFQESELRSSGEISANVPQSPDLPHGYYFFDLVDDKTITFGSPTRVLAEVAVKTGFPENYTPSQDELYLAINANPHTLFEAIRKLKPLTLAQAFDAKYSEYQSFVDRFYDTRRHYDVKREENGQLVRTFVPLDEEFYESRNKKEPVEDPEEEEEPPNPEEGSASDEEDDFMSLLKDVQETSIQEKSQEMELPPKKTEKKELPKPKFHVSKFRSIEDASANDEFEF